MTQSQFLSRVSLHQTVHFTKVIEPRLADDLSIASVKISGVLPFPKTLARNRKQTASSGINTRITSSISFNDNRCVTLIALLGIQTLGLLVTVQKNRPGVKYLQNAWVIQFCYFLGDDKVCFQTFDWGCPRCVMVKALDSGIVVHKFEIQSRYYVHFQTNILGKGINFLILPPMG